MSRSGQRGVSLIELMITITILGILILLGIPSFQQWMLNTRIRTVTESIQNGLRLARNEASQQATNVRFQLNSASNWQVCVLPASAASAANYTDCTNAVSTVQTFDSPGAGSTVQVGAATATTDVATSAYSTILSGGVPAGITFNSLGRPTDYGNTSLIRIDVTAANASLQPDSRRLVTTISAGGMVNMCDPAFTFSTTSPQGCP
jgi:type IV fimbrial biogenesis protein FimT